jgi:hypothetical protein
MEYVLSTGNVVFLIVVGCLVLIAAGIMTWLECGEMALGLVLLSIIVGFMYVLMAATPVLVFSKAPRAHVVSAYARQVAGTADGIAQSRQEQSGVSYVAQSVKLLSSSGYAHHVALASVRDGQFFYNVTLGGGRSLVRPRSACLELSSASFSEHITAGSCVR